MSAVSDTVLWQGRPVRFTWKPGHDERAFQPWSQSCGICFSSEGCIVLVKGGKRWQLPGGGREGNESPQETLQREIFEETTATLRTWALIGAMEVHDPQNPAPRAHEETGHHFQLRYAAIVEKMGPPAPDPATGKTPERILISPSDFHKYIDWGDRGKEMLTAAVAWYNIQR